MVKKSLGSKEKVHEFPNKEATLDDSNRVSFGTGNATYRFSFIPLVFSLCGLGPARSKEFQEKISSVGAFISNKWGPQCTHVLDDSISLNADVVDAILSKRHYVIYIWIKINVLALKSRAAADETVVADSEPEVEITSVPTPPTIRKVESVQHKVKTTSHSISPTKFDDQRNTTTYGFSAKPKDSQRDNGISTREHQTDDDTQLGTSDVNFSQDLIIRGLNVLSSVPSPADNIVLNFKRFRKMATESGNGFYNLVLFSKHPYKGSEYDNEEVAESLKEEKKRKQREAIADDLFNKLRKKRREKKVEQLVSSRDFLLDNDGHILCEFE